MTISDLAKESALIEIFRRNKVTSENGRMPMIDLQKEWTETGLGAADFVASQDALVASGMMVHEAYEGQDGLTLTRIGVDYMSSAPNSFEEVAEAAKDLLGLSGDQQEPASPVE